MKRPEICYRCKSKEAVYTCLMCDSFKLLCTQCDNYVHSLPSKRKHRKVTIVNDGRVENNIRTDVGKPYKDNIVKENQIIKVKLQDHHQIDQTKIFRLKIIPYLNK